MNERRIRLACAVLPALLLAIAPAHAGPPADAGPIEEVVVTGEFPGPGMWKVWRPGEEGHVLWIVGDPPPLPRRLQWKSRDVEAVLSRSQEVLLDVSVRMEPDEKIGVFRGIGLIPSALRARKNPDGRRLQDHVPPEQYARWQRQKQRFLGGDRGIEQWRPIFAADKLRREAVKDLDLREGGMVWEAIGRLAKKQKKTVTRPSLTFTFPADRLKDKIREFSREPLADTGCFTETLDLVDALSDRATGERRARAWATADLAALESLPELPNPALPCAMALLGSQVAREVLPADIRERLHSLWVDHAVRALEANDSTLAIVPLARLMRADGYLPLLRQRGLAVEAPR